jgi:hypothetical protein
MLTSLGGVLSQGEDQGIVTSDLILHYDISNTSSYPGSGTTITDLSPELDNATIINGSYTALNGGGIYLTSASFSRIDLDSASSNLRPATGTSKTYSGWYQLEDIVNPSLLLSDTGLSGNRGWQFGTRSGELEFVLSPDGSTLPRRTSIGASISVSTPYHFAATFDSATTTAKFYINGVLLADDGAAIPANAVNSIYKTQINAYFDGTLGNRDLYFFEMECYNKVLSGSEITQNFNATKTRYGY